MQSENSSVSIQPPSPLKKPNTSSVSERLTNSEIEALRRGKKRLAALALAEFEDLAGAAV